MSEKILISIPTYNGYVHSGLIGATRMATTRYQTRVQIGASSLLPQIFNALWVSGLALRSEGIKKFVMLHADIVPEPYWLDKMVDIQERTGADVLSAIVPIKSHQGLTSTALDHGDHWQPRRLTLKEAFNREPTFTDPALLLNTGLMLVDMSKPWVEQVHFRFEDAILNRKDGFKVVQVSEDWNFSRDATKLGAKLYATREVKVDHFGERAYTNAQVWGALETDDLFATTAGLQK